MQKTLLEQQVAVMRANVFVREPPSGENMFPIRNSLQLELTEHAGWLATTRKRYGRATRGHSEVP